MGRRAFYLLLSCLICGYCSLAQGADRGGINSGETRSGTIGPPSFMDTWTFDGQAGDRVIINAVTTTGTLNTGITLYPPGGGPAEADSGIGGDKLDYQLKNTGLYIIVIQDYGLSKTGNYNITFLKIPGTVSSAEDPDGGPIASGQTLGGTINVPSDMDAFQFYGQTGERVIINAVMTTGTLNTVIALYPPGGGPAEADSGIGGDKLDYQLKNTGLYTIVIQDYGLSKTGSYNLSLSKIPSTPAPGIYNLSPSNGATVYNANGAFKWNEVAGATGYDLYFGDSVTQPWPKIGSNLTQPRMTFPTLLPGKLYYWYVVAHTASGDIQGPRLWFQTSNPFVGSAGPWMLLLLSGQ
jgi:hypothetical protein